MSGLGDRELKMPTHHYIDPRYLPYDLEPASTDLSLQRHHQVRQRAYCLILRHEGYSLSDLITIFKVSRKTLYKPRLA